jgi:tetratricopeptide (TPR) repeat protein
MQRALGNTQAALAHYEAGREIAQRLYDAASENAGFARDLSISFDKLGNMQQALGNTQAALAHYEAGRKIAQRLYDAAPENADFARDLSVSFDNLGNMQRALGNTQAALAHYEAGRKIAQRLYDAAPENADFARDLSVSLNNLGEMQKALGNEAQARSWYRKRLSLAAQTVARQKSNDLAAFAQGFLLSAETSANTLQATRMLASIPCAFTRWAGVDSESGRHWIAAQYGLQRSELDSRIWISDLPFYNSTKLIRIGIAVEEAGENQNYIYFLNASEPECVLLDGQSDWIHLANALDNLQLNENTVMGYLKFFCLFVRGGSSPFFVIEPSDAGMLPRPWLAALEELTIAKSTIISSDPAGVFRIETRVIYETALFKATFEVKATGEVAMIDDEPLSSIEPDE